MSVDYSGCLWLKEAESDMELRGRASKIGVYLSVVGMGSKGHV